MGGVRGCVFVQSWVRTYVRTCVRTYVPRGGWCVETGDGMTQSVGNGGWCGGLWGKGEVWKDCDGRNGGFVGRVVGMDMALS